MKLGEFKRTARWAAKHANLRALEEPEECSHKFDEVVSNINEKKE